MASSISLCSCFLSCFPSVQLWDRGDRCAQDPGPELCLEPQAGPKSQTSSSDRGRGCRGESKGVEEWAAGNGSEMCLTRARHPVCSQAGPGTSLTPSIILASSLKAPSWGWVGEGRGLRADCPLARESAAGHSTGLVNVRPWRVAGRKEASAAS